ncbi:MAG: sigma-54-dependent Fis family transcriptional regulator [Candidatus Dadabacteria bacterium]|nr:MAG: sigma-54-dependent Fis family transcriptional regulator [Candidatus Dadabacteria bacterium]
MSLSEKKKILVVDDDERMQVALKSALSKKGYDVLIAGDGGMAWEIFSREIVDLVISDQNMPVMSGDELLSKIKEEGKNVPFIMITAYGTIDGAVKAMQMGAADFITKPFSVGDLERVVKRVFALNSGTLEAAPLKGKKKRGSIITRDPSMIRIIEIAEAVAQSDATVLIQGESGTGKEVMARFIHHSSPRRKQAFVAVNCAALPENLLESELFGHEKGAFTGAQSAKPGKFELAHGGTILLDEISEMDIALQAKLLRVLQEQEVDRVGGREPISVDVRVIATTNRNLEEMVRQGKFREDLYYRLNVIPITLPPLRERKGDIKLLVEHFMNEYLKDGGWALPHDVLVELERYSWPGNVRELQNAVKRASILSRGDSHIKGAHFFLPKTGNLSSEVVVEKDNRQEDRKEEDDSQDLIIRSGLTVSEMEKRLILETLKATGNNRTQAAKLLGISIRTLRNKLNEYGYAKGR